MLGSPVLNIALGLIFVFLLYSLFATTLMELFASLFGLRARMLRSTIYRMLNDDRGNIPFTVKQLKERLISFICFFVPPRWRWLKPEPSLAWVFYNMPGIKYLGLSSWFKRPSNINPERFAKTVCDVFKESVPDESLSAEEKILKVLSSGQINVAGNCCKLGPETQRFLLSLWAEKPTTDQLQESHFRQLLIAWYNETMELLISRYKKRTQANLFALGFLIAMVFNVNTIEITSRLASNDGARDAMVLLARSWIETHGADSAISAPAHDTLLVLNQLVGNTVAMLNDEIKSSNNLLALGYNVPNNFTALAPILKKLPFTPADSLPDSLSAHTVATSKKDSSLWMSTLQKVYQRRCIAQTSVRVDNAPPSIGPSSHDKRNGLPYSTTLTIVDRVMFVAYSVLTNYALFGFLITAIAISLGAPFWFDLLNKVAKIKNEGKKP